MNSPARTNWFLVILIWLGGLGAAAQYGKVSVIFSEISTRYPEAGSSVGFAVSLVGFVGILLGVVAGMYVSAIGYRRVLVGSLWLGAGVSAVQALDLPFAFFLISRVIEGVSHLGVVVAGPTLIAQVSSDRMRGVTMSLWSTFFGVAFALLAWFGLTLVQSSGISSLFLFHAVIMFGLALVLTWGLKQIPALDRREPPELSQLPRLHLDLYRSPWRSAPAAGWLFYTFSFVAILTVLPPYIDPKSRVMIMAFMPLISILISMTLGIALLTVLRAIRVIQIGFFCCAGVAIWLLFAPGAPAACLALAAGMGLIQSASFAAVPQLNPTSVSRAEASGAMAQAGNLGNTIGTPLMVWVLVLADYSGLMALLVAVFVTGAMAHQILDHRRGHQQT